MPNRMALVPRGQLVPVVPAQILDPTPKAFDAMPTGHWMRAINFLLPTPLAHESKTGPSADFLHEIPSHMDDALTT